MHYILGMMAIIVSPLILFGCALRVLWSELWLYRRARSTHKAKERALLFFGLGENL